MALAIAFAHPPNFAPDTDYEYNNSNYVLLGLIVEKVEGKTLAQAMQDRLFRPLGMLHTALPPSNVTALSAPYSHGTSTAVPRSPSWASRRIRLHLRRRPQPARLRRTITRA
jgi:CubicO group peptidase (beta-lactamase class C family)